MLNLIIMFFARIGNPFSKTADKFQGGDLLMYSKSFLNFPFHKLLSTNFNFIDVFALMY